MITLREERRKGEIWRQGEDGNVGKERKVTKKTVEEIQGDKGNWQMRKDKKEERQGGYGRVEHIREDR
jgi:hypothetical protein